jgi:hypothetical protein
MVSLEGRVFKSNYLPPAVPGKNDVIAERRFYGKDLPFRHKATSHSNSRLFFPWEFGQRKRISNPAWSWNFAGKPTFWEKNTIFFKLSNSTDSDTTDPASMEVPPPNRPGARPASAGKGRGAGRIDDGASKCIFLGESGRPR